MINFKYTTVGNFTPAICGMRNPYNSWDRCDSGYDEFERVNYIGPRDLELAKKLVSAGSEHRKFMRMMPVCVFVEAPLYWWKEMDTYKVGTVSNSCSTMHTLHKRDLTMDDFATDRLLNSARPVLRNTIDEINKLRANYISHKYENEKDIWYSMIQLLPSSFIQKRTLYLNYETLYSIAHQRNLHKLDEWHDFIAWVHTLPYANELIFNDQMEETDEETD